MRNDLITLLAQYDNDLVAVHINGHAVGIETVTMQNGSITIVLDPEEARAAVPADSS